jgi:hypothetical protein
MTVSSAGLIGGVVGFALATLAYLAVTYSLRQAPLPPGATAEERERSMSMLRSILLADIPILTGLGYYLGQTFE